MSTRSTLPASAAASLEDLFGRALEAGVEPGEIEALIRRARGRRDGTACPKCAANRVTVDGRTLDEQRPMALSMPQVMDLDLPDRVVEIAASIFHVKPARRLLGPDRHRDICRARWIASSLLRQQGWSTPKIGRFLSVDHSTVIHGLKRVAGDEVLRRVAAAAARLLVTRSAPQAI